MHSNLTKYERDGLSQLISLQKEGKILIMRCDKTGGFAIVTRNDYKESLIDILNGTIKDKYGILGSFINVFMKMTFL